jgi:hypothetical protein
MSWFCKRVLIMVALGAAFACGGSNSNSTPTAPSGSANTEKFTGGFDVGGSGPVHVFTINQSNGLLNIVLTAVTNTTTGAPAGVAVGLALGSQSSSGCVAISGASATVTAGSTSITSGLSGTANSGSYCLIVFDVGNLASIASPVTYSVDVSHF